MQQVWRTLDGKFFNEAADAEKHEKDLLDNSIAMFDLNGARTTSVSHAYAVFLPNDESATVFLNILRAADEDPANFEQVEEGDTGWYYWDEAEEIWRFVSRSLVRAFAAIVNSDSVEF